MNFHLRHILSFLTLIASCSVNGKTVDTEYGKVEGYVSNVGTKPLDVFLGIKYAVPPVGNLRFTRPQTPDNWAPDVWNATYYRAVCMQVPVLVEISLPDDYEVDEDCLYLNIFVPPRSNNSELLPVLFFIHGGGFTGSSAQQHPGHYLAQNDIIVVTFNYRMGPFGFLTLQSDTARGNYGLFDQLEALKFVNRNIKNFGGDPSRVTIGGESAGAVSSAVHLISPMSYPKGLFSQIILQSGSDVVPWGITEAAIVVPRNYALQLADLLDCPDVTSDDAILECLRDPDDDYIMSLAGLIGVESKPGMLTLSWAPSDDGPGGIIPEHPRIVRKRGEVPTIPALIGITSHEAAWFADFIEGVSEGVNRTVFKDLVTQMIEGFLNIDENDKPALIDAVVFKYTDWTDEENPLLYRDAITQAFTDVSFGNGMDQWARYNTLKSDTYQYVFAYRSEMNILPDWYGVPHALDVPYTFGYPHVVTNQAFAKETGIAAIFNWTDADRAASDEMTKLWANFVKTGNPTPDTNTWKPFKMNDYKYLNIAKPANKLEKDFRIREYAFWREYVPKLVKVENDIPSQTTPKKMPRTTSNPLRTGSSITESPKMSSSSPMRSTQTLQTLKPTTDGTATGNEDKQTNEKLKMTDRWRIATIVVSCVAGLLLLVTLGLIFMKCSTKNKSEENKSLDFELSRNDSANYYDNVASKY